MNHVNSISRLFINGWSTIFDVHQILQFRRRPRTVLTDPGLLMGEALSLDSRLRGNDVVGREACHSREGGNPVKLSLRLLRKQKSTPKLVPGCFPGAAFYKRLHDQSPICSQRRSEGMEASGRPKQKSMKPISFTVGS